MKIASVFMETAMSTKGGGSFRISGLECFNKALLAKQG